MSKMKITFDKTGNIELPVMVLAYRSGDKIGALANIQDLVATDDMSNPSEFSFSIYKKICPKWWQVKDFRLIWVPEWDMWFEVNVTVNEKNTSIKNIIATHLPESELSQLNLYGTEINTDDDIDREGSEATVFFNAKNPDASLLHRVMKKAVNFEIAHVDPSLCNIQRTFTFDKKTIYDALMEIAEEVHCHFEFGTYMDKDRNLIRTVSAYDLESNCNECGYRGEFTNKCPKCGSKDITEGYGEDTTIFFSVENALDEVTYSTNVDAVKNCFKLEAGDEDMTAAVINCNPTGSDTVWYISDEMKKGMSDGLVSKLDGYNTQYNYYHDEKEYGADLPVEGFNELVSKYMGMNQNKDGGELVPPYIYAPDNGFKLISLPVTGYQALSNIYYDTFDLELFLQSGLMPYVSMAGDDTSAEKQAGLLSSSLKTVAVANIDIASEATVKSSVLSMAKAVVDARYKVEVTQSSYNNKIWAGNLLLTSYSDEDDTCETGTMSVAVTGDYGTFIKQKIEKTLSKSDGNSYDIISLFDLQLGAFKKELTRYGLRPLENFRNSCEAVLSVLQEQGVGNPSSYDANSNPSVGDIIDVNLYEEIYVPYYQKQLAIEAEIAVREAEINVAIDMQEAIGEIRNDIKKALDMETFLGEKLWRELNAFRREDVYSNSNYVSDGLSNYEIFQKAEEFFETANKELVKSATLQHSIKVQLRNIFTIREFAPMRKGFAVGNWLRVGVDGTVYKLRLLTYELDYDNYKSMDVEFSDVEKVTNNVTKIRDVLKSARSMASTYSYVERQASQGSEGYTIMSGWVNKGLDATAVNIMNNAESQDVVFGKNGLLCRKYDDILGVYDPEQLKIINSTLAITKNGWETVETAIGRIIYYDPVEKVLKEAYGVNAQVLVGKLILGEELGIYNPSGSLTFNQNGLKVSNDTHDIIIDPNAASLFTITKKGDDGDTNLLSFNDDGNLEIVGDIYATNIVIEDAIKMYSTEFDKTMNAILLDSYGGNLQINIGEPNDYTTIITLNCGMTYAFGKIDAYEKITFRKGMSGDTIDVSGTISEGGVLLSNKYQPKGNYALASHTHLYTDVGAAPADHTHNLLDNNNYRVKLNSNNNFIPTTSNGEGTMGIVNIGSGSNWYGQVNCVEVKNRSDKRLKDEIENISDKEALAILNGVTPKKYHYKKYDTKTVHYGIYAQDLRDILIQNDIGHVAALGIDVIETDSPTNDLLYPEDEVTYSVNYLQLIPTLIVGWKYQEKKIAELESKYEKDIHDLKSKIEFLEHKINLLENLI